MRAAIVVLVLLVSVRAGEALYRQRRSSGPSGSSVPSKDEPLPTFKGTFHSTAGGKVYLDTGEENQLEFWLTRKTVILQGDKKLKAGDLKRGMPVSIEAKRVVATRMDAVTIRVEPQK